MSAPESRQPSAPISMTGVVAIVLGAAAVLLTLVAAGMHPFALILAIAAALVGVVGAINAKRAGQGAGWLGYIGVGLGVVAAIIVAVSALG